MTSIRRALAVGALAASAGLAGAEPAHAQFNRTGSFVGMLSTGSATTTTTTPAVTPAATGGPLGRPAASPITPTGPQLGS